MRTRISFWVAVITAAVVFTLIVWGGIVHNTGSSLGCPDWPLCYGQLIVDTSGMPQGKANEIFWEHTHRFLGTVAGVGSIALLFLLWKPLPQRRPLRWRAILLLDLIVLQGVLGGITVLLRLPALVSTAHLALSLVVMGLLLNLVYQIRTPIAIAAQDRKLLARMALSRYLIALAIVFVYAQTILGGLVRHTWSTMAAGFGWPAALIGIDSNTREYSLWPSYPPAQLNVLHRYVGIIVLAFVVIAFLRLRKVWAKSPEKPNLHLALAPIVLVAAQIVIGVMMLAYWMARFEGINWRILLQTLHLAVPTLILMILYWFMLTLSPRPALRPARQG